jgi:hypothetical protein
MTKRVVVFLVGVSICYACGNGESAGGGDSIAGTYVREYSREILNQLSGNKVGMRTVRDTLYITEGAGEYKIKNSKWSMNDYDDNGWQNMKHGESGPLSPFTAKYDQSSRSLTSSNGEPNLVISQDGKISIGNKSEITYARID